MWHSSKLKSSRYPLGPGGLTSLHEMPRFPHTVHGKYKHAIAWRGWWVGSLPSHLLPVWLSGKWKWWFFKDCIAQMYTIQYILHFRLQIGKSRIRWAPAGPQIARELLRAQRTHFLPDGMHLRTYF